MLQTINDAGVEDLRVLAIDHTTVGAYMRYTLALDKNTTREEALVDIYRVMRPGEPPTLRLRKICSTAFSLILSVMISRRLVA